MSTAAPARERILAAATRRFYAEGVRAVSADRLIADAEISKVTFYRHFRSKDDLVVAYLRRLAEAERTEVAQHVATDSPADALRWYAHRLGEATCAPGFRGCPFINAAAEHADPVHPARVVVAEHRAWLHGQAAALVGSLGVRDPDGVAEQLLMLRDGAMVAGYVGRSPGQVAAALLASGEAVVRAAIPSGA
jgi:AcrR family transcriptional regulator